MKRKQTENPAEQLAKHICEYLSSKKGEDIVLIDVREKTTLCDYFIVASGRSTQQVKSLCENLEEKLSSEGIEPKRTEGVRDGRWGVMDYGDVIVHVFNDESRLFYHLERLWEDGENVVKYQD